MALVQNYAVLEESSSARWELISHLADASHIWLDSPSSAVAYPQLSKLVRYPVHTHTTGEHLEAAERVPQYVRATYHQDITLCNPGPTTKTKSRVVAWVDGDFGSTDWSDGDTRDDSKNQHTLTYADVCWGMLTDAFGSSDWSDVDTRDDSTNDGYFMSRRRVKVSDIIHVEWNGVYVIR